MGKISNRIFCAALLVIGVLQSDYDVCAAEEGKKLSVATVKKGMKITVTVSKGGKTKSKAVVI